MIRDILVRSRTRIREAQKHTVRIQRIRIRNTDTFNHSSKIKSHKEIRKRRNQGFSYYFWWWKDPDTAPYLWLTDPDADSGGPKTYGSCWSGSSTLVRKFPSPHLIGHQLQSKHQIGQRPQSNRTWLVNTKPLSPSACRDPDVKSGDAVIRMMVGVV